MYTYLYVKMFKQWSLSLMKSQMFCQKLSLITNEVGFGYTFSYVMLCYVITQGKHHNVLITNPLMIFDPELLQWSSL